MSKASRHQRILDQSLAWIRDHPNALNTEVPRTLRDAWTVSEADGEPPPSLPVTAFLFGYCQRRLAGSSGEQFTLSATEVAEKFQGWQVKLALAELNEKTDLQSAPLDLFTCEPDETISFWREPTIPSTPPS